jgi:hypothetical protein
MRRTAGNVQPDLGRPDAPTHPNEVAMTERDAAQGVLYLTAQALKAFLTAFDPLERRLEELSHAGYNVRVLVTAEPRATGEPPICYAIQVGGDSAEDGGEWSTEDEDFLRDLQGLAWPNDPSSIAGHRGEVSRAKERNHG